MSFTTSHDLYIEDSASSILADESVDLILTSPPYPMVQQWDSLFSSSLPGATADGWATWEAQHSLLNRTWAQCVKALKPGGFMCINIGDAVRTIEGKFHLFPNHAEVLRHVVSGGMTPLPGVLWRKPTNAPNKFMGSGTLPAGAYVTLEHEHILIFRKGEKRVFDEGETVRRRRSAIFWDERNQWFSDVWMGLPGASQTYRDAKVSINHTAAFPLALAKRLLLMYSIEGDVVVDPFSGTGTLAKAAASTGRHSICIEKNDKFEGPWRANIAKSVFEGWVPQCLRIEDQINRLVLVDTETDDSASLKYKYEHPIYRRGALNHSVRVKTRQERGMQLSAPVPNAEIVLQVGHGNSLRLDVATEYVS